MSVEHWKPIAGYETAYRVSDLGHVYSELSGKQLRPGPNSAGYLTVALYDNARNKRSHCVHDLVMAAFAGPKPDAWVVDHWDENKRNNRFTNLEYVTQAENQRRARERKLARKNAPGICLASRLPFGVAC